MYNKKAQVTIFIILAIIIVAGILISIFFFGGLDVLTGRISNPTEYIKKCATDNAKIVLENIEQHGGVYYLQSDNINFLKFEGIELAKLCYSREKNTICENKHPLLNEEIENKIKILVQPKLEQCFENLKNSYKNQDIIEGEFDFNVKIMKDGIALNIQKAIEITNGENSIEFNDFSVVISSGIYSFLDITNSILNQELSCDCKNNNCNADLGKINTWYPSYSTSRFLTQDSEKIYTILSNDNQNEFMFVVRNCAGVKL